MSYSKGKRFVFIIVAVLFCGALLTGIVMLLWNWLMPDIFGITTITFWQALGILTLAKVFFGGFMSNKSCSHCNHSGSKWKSMSSADKQSIKEKFMQKWSECHASEDTSSTPT